MTARKTRSRFVTALGLLLAANLSAPRVAHAQSEEPSSSSPRYSLPWQLRPVSIGNAARLDGVLAAFNDANGNLDVPVASGLSVSYQATREIAPMLRLGLIRNNAPGAALDGSSLANPLLGARYARSSGPLEWAMFGATTVPIGSGGGNDPNAKAARANLAAAKARPADAALFAVNYMTEMAGADVAFVSHGFTLQVETTLQAQVRVRGSSTSSSLDAFRTNAAVGLHLGYFIGSHFSLGSDLRYERWLLRPTALNVATGAQVPLADRDMDNVTLAAGMRLHFGLGRQTSMHPGLCLMRGFDGRAFSAPLVTRETTAVELDLPVEF